MPSGSPVGSIGTPHTPDVLSQIPQLSAPENPLDVLGTPQPPGNLGHQLPSAKTLMQPAQQWGRAGAAGPDINTTRMVNTNMAAGGMPSGPRAARPMPSPPPPSAGVPQAPAGPAGLLAKQGKAKKAPTPREFGYSLKMATPRPAGMSPQTGAVLGTAFRGLGGAIGGGPAAAVEQGALGGIEGGTGITPEQLKFLATVLGVGGTAALGAGAGAGAGTVAGARRGNTAEGLGRGLIRGGATGAGVAGGAMAGGALGSRIGGATGGAIGTGLGAAAGGITGFLGSGKVLGPPAGKAKKPEEKQSAAFNFGTDIARTMKPKQVTRRESEHRGADMKRGLAAAV